jgi:hypothetical protein
LFGLEAINNNNGWEYALLGICIVFSGLVILSLVISQLHKLLNVWDNRASLFEALKSRPKAVPSPGESETRPARLSESLVEITRQYGMLVDRIGEPFALPKLLTLAEKSGLHRPHATINELLQAGIIVPDETGYYLWKS